MEDFPLPFVPVPTLRRYTGWCAERQVEFIRCLAETGSVTQSAKAVGMSPASAYRLRARDGSRQFAAAWDEALATAGHQLLAVALDRALHGTKHRVYRDGFLIAERIAPSDRLLMWAVDRLLPRAAALPATGGLEEAIAAIPSDDPACTEADYASVLFEEAGRRGDAIHEARDRRDNVQSLLDALAYHEPA
jgi:hypothetical protein